jgi:hypothetical protein
MLNAMKRFMAALFATAGAVMWLTLGSTVTGELTVIDTSLSGSAAPF